MNEMNEIGPRLRELRYVYNLPICVGRNVWSGSGVQIMPGITIGNNSVIGADSVVTKDILSNVKILAGSPFGSYCKRLPILRKALVF